MFRTKFNQDNKVWSGEYKLHFNPQTSLDSEIFNSLKKYGSKVAQICGNTGDTITFDELRILSVRVAKNLQRFGIERGQKIALFIDHLEEIAPLTFGSIFLGCPVIYSAEYSSQMENQHFFSITNPCAVICHKSFYRTVKECVTNLKINVKIFTVDCQIDDSIPVQTLFEAVDNESDFKPAMHYSQNDTIFIVHTSGTTGHRKIFCISHASIVQKMKALKGLFRPSDVVLKMSILVGVSGLRYLLGTTLNGSARLVNIGPCLPARFFELVERFEVSMAHTSAFMAIKMLKDPKLKTANLSSIRYLHCGGSNISFHTIQMLNQYLKNGKFCAAYGLTETFGTMASNLEHARNNCVGQLISGYEAIIVNDQGERLGVNKLGEICIKCPLPFTGYLNDTQNIEYYVDKDGFFRTGDEGRFDENGDLFVIDRKKEIFERSGYRISPVEIESFLNIIDGIKQSCVVPVPSEKEGYVAAAVIIKDQFSDCTEQSIYGAVAKQFPIYKHLDGGIYVVDAIPLTNSGKISRYLMRQMATELYNIKNKHRSVGA